MAQMDEVERQRFLETLRNDEEFRATVRRELLTQELLDLPGVVSTLVGHQADMQASLTVLTNDVGALARQQAELQRAMTSLTELVAAALAATRERLESVESSMTELKTDMTELKTDMTERFASMSSGFTARFDQLDAAVAELRNERGT